ncbi:MAG: FAD-dependent oxidoreductase [Paracoccus sp. (in: a-proteobacteria)]|nr:FAD-dependent oxidoreductase [Paracoccus sp. (in: a-proteobacteria)]
MPHAVVIGAGIIGCSIACELARAGWQVTVTDKGPEAGYGSTSNSSAVIRTYYSVYESCALAYEGWAHWRDWAGHLGLADGRPLARYVETGCLVVKADSNGHLANVCAMMDRIGCPYRHVTAQEILDYLPGADLSRYAPAKRPDDPAFCEPTGGAIAGGVFFPQGGYVNDPKLAAQNLQWAAEAAGARFLFHAQVAGLIRETGRAAGVVLQDGRRIAADIVVNAGGPWSSGLNRMAGVTDGMRISTRPNRQEVAYIPGPRNMDFARDGLVFSDGDTEVYGRPDPIGICIGSADPQCDPREWVENPDALDTRFTDAWTVNVMRMAQRLPEMAIPGQATGVVALYDVSDDWLPIYDTSDLPGFYMACGTSGNQFKNAPVVGKLMTHLITRCESGHDHDADPIVFPLERIGREISLATYSRKRQINADSSFSVMG